MRLMRVTRVVDRAADGGTAESSVTGLPAE